MKKYVFPLLAALALPLLLGSCKDDEDTASLSEDCYISGLTLGSLYRSMYQKTSAGQDSIYTTTFAGSYFPMTIDQRALTIENLDSLPVRTRRSTVPVSVAFQGALFWRKASNTTGEWTAYSSSDSLDLTEPMHLQVVSLTGNSSRTYTLKVNVHQQNGDSTVWNNLGESDLLNGLSERKAFVWNGQLTLLGKDSGGGIVCAQRPTTTAGTWALAPTTGTTNARPSTLQKQGGDLYLSTSDGDILTSTDARNWTVAPYPTMSGLTLVAASDDYLYGLCDNALYRSNGGAWEEEKTETDGSLPTEQLSTVFYTLPNGNKRLLLVGSCSSTDETATLWAKAWSDGEETEETWMYYTPNGADKYRCPLLTDLCILPYDNGLQALGGQSKDGKMKALAHILHSYDHGISWRTYDNNDMEVDSELQKDARAAQHLSATVDDDQFLWIVADTKVWRGRINRLGFLRK